MAEIVFVLIGFGDYWAALRHGFKGEDGFEQAIPPALRA
jgi:glycine cleavage system aminomethyltransferase T